MAGLNETARISESCACTSRLGFFVRVSQLEKWLEDAFERKRLYEHHEHLIVTNTGKDVLIAAVPVNVLEVKDEHQFS